MKTAEYQRGFAALLGLPLGKPKGAAALGNPKDPPKEPNRRAAALGNPNDSPKEPNRRAAALGNPKDSPKEPTGSARGFP